MPKIQRIIQINKPCANEKIKLLQHEVEAAQNNSEKWRRF